MSGVPRLIAAALDNKSYSKGEADYSATDLVAPPRVTVFKSKNPDLMERDPAQEFRAMVGTAVHEYLEKFKVPGVIREERLFAEIEGCVISGAIDCQTEEDGSIRISDYKTTGVYKATSDDVTDWEYQLNIYAWLARKNNIDVHALEIICLMLDWKNPNDNSPDWYPKEPWRVIEIPLWSFEEQESFIRSRINDLTDAEFDQERDCTDEERWYKPPQYAVWKKGGKRPSKVFDNREDANAYRFRQKQPIQYDVEERPAQYIRCERFCPVRDFCPQLEREKNARHAN